LYLKLPQNPSSSSKSGGKSQAKSSSRIESPEPSPVPIPIPVPRTQKPRPIPSQIAGPVDTSVHLSSSQLNMYGIDVVAAVSLVVRGPWSNCSISKSTGRCFSMRRRTARGMGAWKHALWSANACGLRACAGF